MTFFSQYFISVVSGWWKVCNGTPFIVENIFYLQGQLNLVGHSITHWATRVPLSLSLIDHGKCHIGHDSIICHDGMQERRVGMTYCFMLVQFTYCSKNDLLFHVSAIHIFQQNAVSTVWFYRSANHIQLIIGQNDQGPVVQSIVSLTNSLSVLPLYNQIHWNFLSKKWEKLLHCKSFSQFFNKKYWHIREINFRKFNETLTNDVISFEQPGPAVCRF